MTSALTDHDSLTRSWISGNRDGADDAYGVEGCAREVQEPRQKGSVDLCGFRQSIYICLRTVVHPKTQLPPAHYNICGL